MTSADGIVFHVQYTCPVCECIITLAECDSINEMEQQYEFYSNHPEQIPVCCKDDNAEFNITTIRHFISPMELKLYA